MLLSSDLGERSPQSPPSLDPPLGRPRVRLGRVLPYQDAAGSCKDLVNWYCSLPTRRTMYARAAGSTHRTQKNEWTETRNCTNSVSALQDHCSHKAPTTNHHIKKKRMVRVRCLRVNMYVWEPASSFLVCRDASSLSVCIFRLSLCKMTTFKDHELCDILSKCVQGLHVLDSLNPSKPPGFRPPAPQLYETFHAVVEEVCR